MKAESSRQSNLNNVGQPIGPGKQPGAGGYVLDNQSGLSHADRATVSYNDIHRQGDQRPNSAAVFGYLKTA